MNLIKDALYLNDSGSFVRGDISIHNGVITSLSEKAPSAGKESVYADGCRVIPGLIDIHTHGAAGYDVSMASADEIRELSRFLARHGVSSFCPTTISADMESVYTAMRNIRAASEMPDLGAAIVGVHMEGPYISPGRRGCHDLKLIKSPDIHEFDIIREILGDKLKFRITVAPDVDGASEFIKYACAHGARVTLGHTDADEKTALKALEYGADSFTHLFNAMRGINHREPGTAGAALISDAYVELICDGIHIHPDIIRLVCMAKKPDQVIAITDAMHATARPDGDYEFCGMKIRVTQGIARTLDGTLAGSTLLLFSAVKNIMSFAGVPFEQAVKYATANPAKAIGAYDRVGSITVGKSADFTIVDKNLDLVCTYCAGKKFLPEK